MKQREADFGVLLRHFFATGKQRTCLIEIKQTTTGSLPFNCFEPGQVAYLQAAKSTKGVLIRNSGGMSVPDYSYYRNEPAYVGVRYPKSFHLIDIDTFLMEQQRSKRKSLTEARAAELSTISVKI